MRVLSSAGFAVTATDELKDQMEADEDFYGVVADKNDYFWARIYMTVKEIRKKSFSKVPGLDIIEIGTIPPRGNPSRKPSRRGETIQDKIDEIREHLDQIEESLEGDDCGSAAFEAELIISAAELIRDTCYAEG